MRRCWHAFALIVRSLQEGAGGFRLPQVALDASGLMLTRPDSFMPPGALLAAVRLFAALDRDHVHVRAVDIVLEDGLYTIYMDVPGLSAKVHVFWLRYLVLVKDNLWLTHRFPCNHAGHHSCPTKRDDHHQRSP